MLKSRSGPGMGIMFGVLTTTISLQIPQCQHDNYLHNQLKNRATQTIYQISYTIWVTDNKQRTDDRSEHPLPSEAEVLELKRCLSLLLQDDGSSSSTLDR